MRFMLPSSPLPQVLWLRMGSCFPISLYVPETKYQKLDIDKPIIEMVLKTQSLIPKFGTELVIVLGEIQKISWKLFPKFPSISQLQQCMDELDHMFIDRTISVGVSLHDSSSCSSLTLDQMPDWMLQWLSPFAVP